MGTKRGEPIPYFVGIPGVSVSRLVPNHIEVSLANGWQDTIEGGFDAGSGTQGAGEGFRGALGVGFDGKAHFGEGGFKFPLPQQEIAVSPGHLGGKGVNLFGVQKGVTRSNQIGFRFVSGGKIQPDFRRCRIQRQSRNVGANGAPDVGILEVVLAIAAQQIPVTSVVRLEMGSVLDSFEGLQGSEVNGAGITDARIGKSYGKREGGDNKYSTVRGVAETQNHSPVLCLDRSRVARQLSIATNTLCYDFAKSDAACRANLGNTTRTTRLLRDRGAGRIGLQLSSD